MLGIEPQIYTSDDSRLVKMFTSRDPDIEFPDLLISTGQDSIEKAHQIREMSCGKTFSVFLQYPHVSGDFDLVIMPRHDDFRVSCEVCITEAALHDVTLDTLTQAARQFSELWENPSPRVAVFVGATNSNFRLGIDEADRIVVELREIKRRYGGSLLISTSHRTDPMIKTRLREQLVADCDEFWDEVSPNPYLGYLACADYIIVTPDSLSMLTEATATGKPVYFAELPKIGQRHRPFFENMIRLSTIRPFRGELEIWTYCPLNDLERASEAIKQGLLRKKSEMNVEQSRER